VAPHHVACGACPLCQGGSETLCRHFKENLLDPGGFSELVLVKERCVRAAAWKVPVNVCDEAAIWLEPAACVLRGVRRSGLAEGGVALVLGAGSMGLLHVAVLHAVLPDAAVWCVEPLEPRRALALRLGARGAWPPESARDLLREANGGLGADVVFDTVGGVTGLDQALDLCREGGSIVLFAHAGPSERGRLDFNRIFKEERRLIGSYSSALSEQSEVRELLAGGRLDPSCLVTEWLKLSEFDEAVELVKTHQAVKVILGPG
jgi:L-iditol 2-dehydrogenase